MSLKRSSMRQKERPTSVQCRCGAIFRPRFNSLNQTRCDDCERSRLEQKQDRKKLRRERPGRVPERREWNRERPVIRRDANVLNCEVCSYPEAKLKKDGLALAGDHIIPLRLITEHKFGNANVRVNIMYLCPSCHGRKKHIEDKICKGFIPEFLKGLYRMNWPMQRVFAALDLYEIWFPPYLRTQYSA